MSIYPTWFRVVRSIIKPFWSKMEVRGAENIAEPCVLITRHLNNYGPVAVYLFSPVEFHLWSLHVFLDSAAYYQHTSEYTFSKRIGMPKAMASLLAGMLCHLVPWFMRQIKTIPVYRGMKTILKTMELSVDELERGENVLIMSDVNYVGEGQDIGEMYRGFVHLGKMYYKRTGGQLKFVPMSINRREHYLRFGKSLLFDPAQPYQQERDRIVQALHDELHDDY